MPTQDKHSARMRRAAQVGSLAYKLTKTQQLLNTAPHQFTNSSIYKLANSHPHKPINSKTYTLTPSPTYKPPQLKN